MTWQLSSHYLTTKNIYFRRRKLPEMDLVHVKYAIRNMWLAARLEVLGMDWIAMFELTKLVFFYTYQKEVSLPSFMLAVCQEALSAINVSNHALHYSQTFLRHNFRKYLA